MNWEVGSGSQDRPQWGQSVVHEKERAQISHVTLNDFSSCHWAWICNRALLVGLFIGCNCWGWGWVAEDSTMITETTFHYSAVQKTTHNHIGEHYQTVFLDCVQACVQASPETQWSHPDCDFTAAAHFRQQVAVTTHFLFLSTKWGVPVLLPAPHALISSAPQHFNSCY